MRETVVEQYLTRKVHRLGGLCVKHVAPGRAGDPDRLVKIPGHPAALCELKRPGGVVAPIQTARQREWRAAGMVCEIAFDHDDVDAFIEKVLRSHE